MRYTFGNENCYNCLYRHHHYHLIIVIINMIGHDVVDEVWLCYYLSFFSISSDPMYVLFWQKYQQCKSQCELIGLIMKMSRWFLLNKIFCVSAVDSNAQKTPEISGWINLNCIMNNWDISQRIIPIIFNGPNRC